MYNSGRKVVLKVHGRLEEIGTIINCYFTDKAQSESVYNIEFEDGIVREVDKRDIKGYARVYLSGPMSIMKTEKEFVKRFNYYEEKLNNMGYDVVNPVNPNYEKSYGANMKNALALLLDCNCIFYLPEAILSKGARVEQSVADACGLHTILLDDGMSLTDNFQTKNEIY